MLVGVPCNVVVRTDLDDETTIRVAAMNPRLLVDVTEEPALEPVADQVSAKLQAVIDSFSPRQQAVAR